MHETTSSMDQAVYVVHYSTEVQEAACNMQRASTSSTLTVTHTQTNTHTHMHETTSSMDQAVYVVPYNTEVQEAAYNMQRGSGVQHAARGSAQRASRGTPCTSLPLANKYGPLGRCVQCPYISASYNCARGTMLSIEEHLHHAVRNTRHAACSTHTANGMRPAARSVQLYTARTRHAAARSVQL